MRDSRAHSVGCVVYLLWNGLVTTELPIDKTEGSDLELLVVLPLIMHLDFKGVDLQQLGAFLSLILAALTDRRLVQLA